jgi:hypothetical protein
VEKTKLQTFIDTYKRTQDEYLAQHPPGSGLRTKIKVAILDNGVDMTLLDETFKGTDGASFVCDESPWWLVQELHGTQMAHIIHALDPFCELKIEKICEMKRDFTAERVARVSRMRS